MTAIFKREFRAYFTSPLGYVYCGAFLLVMNLLFSFMCVISGSGDLSPVFSWMLMVLTFTSFILTMRLFSEEMKQKTDQLLLTAPVKLTGLVMGKFLSAMMVFVLVLCGTLVWPLVISLYGTPNVPAIVGNYAAILAVAAVYISMGMFISVLTENQLVAAVGALGGALVFMLLDYAAALLPTEWLKQACAWLSVFRRYQSFSQGLFSADDIIFFLSLTAVFIFLTVRVLEKKRWS